MVFNGKQFSSILEALRASSRGMNVTEVAKATRMNRATVAKYLEVLFISGHVDMRAFGTSKLYYISQRMPISAFLNFSSDLIIVLDKDSRVLNANDIFFEFTNTRREDVVHKNIGHFAFPLQFDPPIQPSIIQAINGQGSTIESYYRKKDWGYYFNVKLIPLVFDGGEKGVAIIFEDITDKKLAEMALRDSNKYLEKKVRERTLELERSNEALRKSEAYLVEAQQIARLGCWSYNLKTKDVYASEETCDLFGIEQGSEWTYELFKSRLHPDDVSRVENTDKEAIAGGKPINYEYRIILPDRSERIIHSMREVMFDASGEAVELFGTIQDVTEHRRMEKELKANEEKYRNILENINVMVWEIDENYRFTYINNKSRDILGYRPEELVGRMPVDFMAPEEAKRVGELFKPILDKQQPFELLDYYLVKKDGSRTYFKTNGMPIYDDAGRFKGYRGVTRDITNGRR